MYVCISLVSDCIYDVQFLQSYFFINFKQLTNIYYSFKFFVYKFGRRSDLGLNCVNPVSRQIYLTFPAESNLKEEDVSNYFSNFGPVQDVSIPYQQKRMFGFVTFDFPETVKLILAKGNPHFVCDARVLVKPYKEKGKIPDKHRTNRKQQQMERGDFTGCGSPTGLESRDPFDLGLGARMFYNTRDMLWNRKLEEQADLQQSIELQNRRLMGLQLLDVKRNSHHPPYSFASLFRLQQHFSQLPSVVRTSSSSSKQVLVFRSPEQHLGAGYLNRY
ncbi:zinc finger CCCH domain-containing protein 53 [Phtheirospermum japonicum]|uniref:Zinc finger CCCH domain-containing protein 53 n=1 Tax=Phtheirospermum japonicum TaxID=374723 RepID=A0A830CKS7_9LAMI|nr:zinc finger CCCH domain-containing protein 53 [Phtheirospermum japonicum]